MNQPLKWQTVNFLLTYQVSKRSNSYFLHSTANENYVSGLDYPAELADGAEYKTGKSKGNTKLLL